LGLLMASSTTVNFNLKDAGYANYADQTITFTLKNVGTDNSDTGSPVIARSSVSAKSDSNGDGSLTVFVNGASDIGTNFDVTLPGGEHVEVIIPSSAADSSIELSTLLVSHQVAGSTPISVTTYDAARNRDNHTGFDDLTSDVTGVLPVANGGTNSSTAAGARTNLDAQQQSDTLDDLGVLSVVPGTGRFIVSDGTGSFEYQTGSQVRDSIGLGETDTPLFSGVDLTGGTLILDADNDTTINATIDDFIFVRIGGTDKLIATTIGLAPFTNNSYDLGTSSSGFRDLYLAGTATVGALDVSDGDITNAGDVNCDEISTDDGSVGLNVNFNGVSGVNKISLADNLANALDITEGSNSYLKFVSTNAGEKIVAGKDIEAAAVTGTDVLATDSLGYGAGNGGTVTQLTSITTAVTLNAICGVITCVSNDYASNQVDTFTLNNTFISPTDIIIVSFQDGHPNLTVSASDVNTQDAQITIKNGTNTAANGVTCKINFAVIKTSTT